MKELLLSTIWSASNDGELALITSYLTAATTRATTGFLSRQLNPKQTPGAPGGYTWPLMFSPLVKLTSLCMTWLRGTVGRVERCCHQGNMKTWNGQKKRMNQREKERKSQEKWKKLFSGEKKNLTFLGGGKCSSLSAYDNSRICDKRPGTWYLSLHSFTLSGITLPRCDDFLE